ncbi:MAG: hypothetical protein GXY03_14170 [Solirubrobacterales bacterium]|nr:hypothetical protein [Solirubrobacterales bacterium]
MDRKLDVGGTLSQVFSIYGSQAGVLLPLAFVIYLVVGVVSGLLLGGGGALLLLIVVLVGVVANTLYQGMVVTLVSDVQDGARDYSVGDLANSAMPVVLPLIGAGILAGIGIAIGMILLVIPGLILLTFWSVIAPAIVVERTGVLAAFSRSWNLVKGNAWRVFGVIVAVFLIVGIARAVLGAIAVGISDTVAMRIIFDVIAGTLTAPIAALVAAVLFFSLRGIKEGGEPVPPETTTPGPATA